MGWAHSGLSPDAPSPTSEAHAMHKTFDGFSAAFDYCRECNRPVMVIVTGEAWRLFPSGHAQRVNNQQDDSDHLRAEVRQANIDYLARGLYGRYRLCSTCFGAVTLAEQLQGCCPHCQSLILAGPDITPERGREMLATLKARRVELASFEPDEKRRDKTAAQRGERTPR
jgi:hypothetical protein